jgi:hypothetical protein
MSYTNIYNYPATETADLIFGDGVSNENSADIARTSSIVSNAPAGTDLDAIRAYVDAVHGSNTEYQTAATRIGGAPPKIWEFLRLKR